MDMGKLTRFIVLCGILILPGCGPAAVVKIVKSLTTPRLKGSGVVVSETREVGPFHAIELNGSVRATVTIGDAQPIELSGEDNVLPVVTTEVHDGVLKIDLDYDGSVQTTESITATISVPLLDRVELNGACSAEVAGVESQRLAVELNGASQLKLDCHSESVEVDLDGASRLELTGTCQQLNVDLDGATRLNAVELESENANVEVDGASRANVYVRGKLVADADGASSIRYAGNPSKVESDQDGASSIRTLE